MTWSITCKWLAFIIAILSDCSLLVSLFFSDSTSQFAGDFFLLENNEKHNYFYNKYHLKIQNR